jgi:hypothetical protein
MSIPKWKQDFLAYYSNHRVQGAQELRQRHWPDEARVIMSGVADIFEKEGREIERIARDGTNEEKERLYHDIVHGPPGKILGRK